MVEVSFCLIFCEKSNLRRRIAGNLAPCSCAGTVEYSSTLLYHARRKTRHFLALHPPDANNSVFAGLKNHNLCGMFCTLTEMFVYMLLPGFHKIRDIT